MSPSCRPLVLHWRLPPRRWPRPPHSSRPLLRRRPAVGRQAVSFEADVALRAAFVAPKAVFVPLLVLVYLAYYLKYDSVHRQFQGTPAVKEEGGKEFPFVIGVEVTTFHEKDPRVMFSAVTR